jgi:hypothetical protein
MLKIHTRQFKFDTPVKPLYDKAVEKHKTITIFGVRVSRAMKINGFTILGGGDMGLWRNA